MMADRNCVLLVDDRDENRDSIRMILALGGYATEEAQSISDAVDRLRIAPIDLVLTDVRMGRDDDGLELLRRVKARWPCIPVIVYTAFGTVGDAVLATKLGAADYLEWPLEPDSILEAIKTALSKASSLLPTTRSTSPETSLSASRRWASYVLRAVDSADDPKTLSAWARCAGLSYTSLREACYLLGIRPQDARDFTRALRVVVRFSQRPGKLTTLLDASDRRGLKLFCQRVGLPTGASSQMTTLETFLRTQTLIPLENEGLIEVRDSLAARAPLRAV
jgi:DNA-binding response OmpR family regulator